ncbi:C39 family peptidase [Streptosporangium sp. NPDC004379]|uniref:C39 family peptidase n=1 Tax=Streptosporangium sp. NPDC004379 TaxID=3366189 RepID=UPI003685EA62
MSSSAGARRVALHRRADVEPQEIGLADHRDPFGDAVTTWKYARWTGEETPIGFPAAELVPSWTASAPPGSWIQVELRARTASGDLTRWYVMGRWAEEDGDIHRTSLPGQGDEHGDVAVDTYVAARPVTAYRLRFTLYGSGARVHGTAVMASAPADAAPPDAVHTDSSDAVHAAPLGAVHAAPRAGAGHRAPTAAGAADARTADARTADAGTVPAGHVELDVPCRSQKVHAGHFPQWDGGGANWCAPASTSMVLAYWGRGPAAADLDWVPPDDPCPAVDHAARGMYDHGYQGTGNWPFGVAYAGRYGLTGFVTRLRSLAELERLVRAGIPVITSQSFREHELPGSGYSTGGHIMVVAGFTADGDVIVNDPAAPGDHEVRRVYPRAAFGDVWLRSSGSGGIAHVIHPPGFSLPPSDGNW